MKPDPIPLSGLQLGDKCIIDSYTDDSIKLKLLELGCLPGEEVIIDRFAPLGDPIAIAVSGSVISIRKDEADYVLVNLTNK